jgi:hypothetical protein
MNPDERVFSQITAPDSVETAVAAMREFLARNDEPAFERAVALYVAAARAREEPIERVAGALAVLASDLGATQVITDLPQRQSRMHQLIFTGILRAFYGDVAVERGIGASAQRKADAPQHVKAGTWPSKPG